MIEYKIYDEELIELENILKSRNIKTVYQPIVSLLNGEVIGYEALTRGPQNSFLQFPDKLFEIARKYNKTWEVELLCRLNAIEKLKNIKENELLFINVDPYIFRDENFEKGLTKECLASYNISSKNIIFEITEKTAIEDYYSFNKALRNYIDQGFKIAIDDTGSGYSGLKTISETRPHYIKIDMDIIRDINKDTFKQALIEAFVKLSTSTNMKLIAEGIETEEELSTLINLGVCYAQGYFISKPKYKIEDISNNIKNKIKKYNKLKRRKYIKSGIGYIGEIVRCDNSYREFTKCITIKNDFDKSDITGACIVNKYKQPIGLIMKSSLDSYFSKLYGNEIFRKQDIDSIMDRNPLIVDYYTDISQVSNAAMSRLSSNVYDYVIVTKDTKYYGIVTIKSLLHYTTMIESNYARQLNPLSGLPGNTLIDTWLEEISENQKNYCILYFDLDNFKVYNDNYGFENGDKMLRYLSNLIKYKAKSKIPFEGYVGHIGGDDFVYVIEEHKEECEELCKIIIEEFDENVKSFYNLKDVEKGYIYGKNRNNEHQRFPLTSLTIGGIYGTFNSPEEIGIEITKIKKKLKTIDGSCFEIQL